jgi:hypothetical protein
VLGYGGNSYWNTSAHWQLLFSVALIFAVTTLFSIGAFMLADDYEYHSKQRYGWRIAVSLLLCLQVATDNILSNYI